MSAAGLLASLREDPGDEVTRLVVADWEEEQGDPARAELLRVQNELDRWVPELEPREALQKRQAELLAAHSLRWLGPFATTASSVSFAEGLFRISLPSSALLGRRLKAAAEWFASAPIGTVHLTIDKPALVLPRLARTPRLEGVVDLDLSGNGLTDAHLAPLLESSRIESVRRLNLANNRLGPETLDRLERSGILHRLLTLDLRNNSLTAEAVSKLLRRAADGSLRDLEVMGNGLDARTRIAVVEWCRKRGSRDWQGPQPRRLINAPGMEFVRIPAGVFRMGSPVSEEDHRDHEAPIHTVRLTRPFYLARCPTTQGQYADTIGERPSFFTDPAPLGLDLPVDSVNFHSVVSFCDRLSALPGEREQGRRYRLPTEAEWEFACRAGTTTAFWWGESGVGREANFDGTRPYNTHLLGPYLQQTTHVGSYLANPFDLFDTHGNLWEWCADHYENAYYRTSPGENPLGPPESGRRVLRGGSWHSDAPWCRSAYRCSDSETTVQNWYGFRVALDVA